MAIRTISNTGGNYNSTGTWVEGAVPTSADDIVATATSGQLTINVASAARTIDLTNYNNTITMNANWTVSGTVVSSMIGSSTTTYNAGTGGFLIFSGATHNLSQQIGSSRIPNLRLSQTKTLTSDLYVVNFETSALSTTINGFSLYVSGNFGSATLFVSAASVSGMAGTTKFILDGSGNLNAAIGNSGISTPVNFEITGSYSTPFGMFLLLSQGASFSASSTSTISGVNINLYKSSVGNSDTLWINTNSKRFNNLILSYFACSPGIQSTFNLINPLIFNSLLSMPVPRPYTSDSEVPPLEFTGSFLSASNVSLLPLYRTNSSTTQPVITYRGPEIRLASGLTHSIGAIQAIGGLGSVIPSNTNALIRSTTPGSQAFINLGSETASQIINYNFTDINAVGRQIVAINGTFSNTSNITNVYPTGGTGSSVSGGSWTFIQ